jgi:hypothetical protein
MRKLWLLLSGGLVALVIRLWAAASSARLVSPVHFAASPQVQGLVVTVPAPCRGAMGALASSAP